MRQRLKRLEEALGPPTVIKVLDGLEEVPENLNHLVEEAVAKAMEEEPRARFVVVCIEYLEEQGPPVIEAHPLP